MVLVLPSFSLLPIMCPRWVKNFHKMRLALKTWLFELLLVCSTLTVVTLPSQTICRPSLMDADKGVDRTQTGQLCRYHRSSFNWDHNSHLKWHSNYMHNIVHHWMKSIHCKHRYCHKTLIAKHKFDSYIMTKNEKVTVSNKLCCSTLLHMMMMMLYAAAVKTHLIHDVSTWHNVSIYFQRLLSYNTVFIHCWAIDKLIMIKLSVATLPSQSPISQQVMSGPAL